LILVNLGLIAATAAVAADGDCYKNKPGPAPNYIGSSDSMVPFECNKMCADKNYSYFGVRWSNECWCGNEAPDPSLKLAITKCYKVCSGNPMLACGGAHEANVWKVCKDTNCKFVKLWKKKLERMKNEYIHLDRNDEKTYKKKVRKLLPELLSENQLAPGEIGIAKQVTDPKSRYPPLALLKGDGIVEERPKNKVVSINGTVIKRIKKRDFTAARYRPTGLYAPPGDIITITIPDDLVGKIGVNVGQDNENKIEFHPLRDSTQKIGSPYGGLIIIYLNDIDASTRKGVFDVTIDNAVQAPLFNFGTDTNKDWERMKHSASPWSVLRIPGRVQIYIQTVHVKREKNIVGVMDGVRKTFDVADNLIGIDGSVLPGEEQLHYDPTVGGGLRWHICAGGGKSAVGAEDWENFLAGHSSITYHEMGHGFCYSDLPGMGAQWTAEIVREYIERVRNLTLLYNDAYSFEWPLSVLHRMVSFKTFNKNQRSCVNADGTSHYSKGVSYKVDSYFNCWTTLYRLPLWEFGFDILRQVLTADSVSTAAYNSKTDRMADLYCKATKHNLIPMFNFFNIKVSPSVADPCKKQKSPKLITKYIKLANCILTKDIMECVKMPEFPEHTGVCRFNGVCKKNPDNDGKTTTFKDKLDTWGMTSSPSHGLKNYDTMKNETTCLARAVDVFSQCGNDASQSISASFTLEDGTTTSKSYPPKGNCYSDWPRQLPKHAGSSSKMVPAVCNKMCAKLNYAYFGVQWYNECWCGNNAPNMGKKLEITKCDTMCKGNNSLRCGGGYKANVWKVCKENEKCKFNY